MSSSTHNTPTVRDLREALRLFTRLGKECERILERGGPGADRPSAGTAEYESHVLTICNRLIALGREEVIERDIGREGPHKITLLDLDDLPQRVAETIKDAGLVSVDELAEAVTREVVRGARVARELSDDDDGSLREGWKRRIRRSLVANGEAGKVSWGRQGSEGPKELAVVVLNALSLRPAAAAAAKKLAKRKNLTSVSELHVVAVGVQRGNRDLIEYALRVLGLSNRQGEQLLHDINAPHRRRAERVGINYVTDAAPFGLS